MNTLIIYAFCIGLMAVVYRCILAYEDILNWWFTFGRKFDKFVFYKPIWGCEKCFAGQIAFWTYGINWLKQSQETRFGSISHYIFKVIPKYSFGDFNALNWLIFICLSIGLANVFSKMYEKYIK